MNPQDVVDTANSQTFPKEGEHCTDDVCLAQELVSDELSRPSRDSERDAVASDCRGFGQAPDVANVPLRRCCVQVVHVVDDFRWQRVPFSTDSDIGNIEVLQKRQHQDRVTHDVTVIHVL